MKKLLLAVCLLPLTTFGQSGFSDDVGPHPVLVLALYAIGVLITILITRAVFSIPRIVRHQKAQTALLLQIAINTLPRKDAFHARELNKIIDGVGDDIPRIDTQAPEWK